MHPVRFEEVDTLIVDPDRAQLDVIKMVLRNSGFRIMRLGTSIADLEAALKEKVPDLLIAEANLGGATFHNFIHSLRHYEVGGNPFLPVIALSREPTPELVRSVINSGADDLVPKPISTGHLLKRIETLIQARKPFVVTSEYIGPDRRTAKDRPEDIPLIEVPNSLRIKATGETNPDVDAGAIAAAIDEINIQKLERYAVQIGWLIERIVPGLSTGKAPDKETQAHLGRLLYVAEDTSRRMVGTKYAHVSDLCQSLIKVTRDIRATVSKPASKDVQLLAPLSQAISRGFDSAEETAKAARQISRQVGR
jgi:DNA-binding response OmpR family regulator